MELNPPKKEKSEIWVVTDFTTMATILTPFQPPNPSKVSTLRVEGKTGAVTYARATGRMEKPNKHVSRKYWVWEEDVAHFRLGSSFTVPQEPWNFPVPCLHFRPQSQPFSSFLSLYCPFTLLFPFHLSTLRTPTTDITNPRTNYLISSHLI